MRKLGVLVALAASLVAGQVSAQVANGSFEGTVAPWVVQTIAGGCLANPKMPPNGATYDNPQPATAVQGTQYAELHVNNNNSICALYQDVAITAATSQLTLSAASGFNGGAAVAGSAATAEVTTTTGTVLITLYSRNGSQPADGNFNTYRADLTPFVGQTVRIRYTVSNNASCCATVFADAVSLAPSAASVPTMSEWAMILFGLVLAGCAALFIQRRRIPA